MRIPGGRLGERWRGGWLGRWGSRWGSPWIRQWVTAASAPACALCGAAGAIGGLCAPCLAELPRLPESICARCAAPGPAGEICGRCLVDPPAFDSVLPAAEYAFPVDAMIHRLKFSGALWIAPVLANLLVERLASVRRPDALVPMPLSDRRLTERGFNQSGEIARLLSRQLGIAVRPNLLRRARDTRPQSGLSFAERALNVRGAFVVDRPVDGLHLALVDDVVTTGTTANEAARALRRCGAQRVDVWVIARTLRMDGR